MLLAKRRIVASLLAGVALALTAGPVQAQTTLRYQFKVGDQLTYDLQTASESKATVGGVDITSELKLNIDVTWRVVEVDRQGKARVAEKINRVRMTMQEPGQQRSADFDSKDGKIPEGKLPALMASFFSAIAGSEILLTMDPRGEISDVKLPDKVIESLKKLATGGGALDDMVSPDGLKRMFDEAGLVLPGESVSKGATWTKKTEKKMPFGMMKGINKMTYEGPATEGGRTLAKISVRPVVTLEPDPKAPITVKMKGIDSKGTAWFDNAAGRLVEMKLTENMQMAVSVGGMEFIQNVRGTTIMKLRP